MFMIFARRGSVAAWAALLALVLGTPLALPAPARAAGTTDWRCTPRADRPQTLVLTPADLGRTNTDRRLIDLDCIFTPTLPGPSQVTVCIAAPDSENGNGVLRRIRRQDGKETIEYRLTAEPGSVPGALPFATSALGPTLQPLYTVAIDHGDTGSVSFRHQIALLTEFERIAGLFLPDGDYADSLSGLAISIHDGKDCGFLLWGPPDDSLGGAADVTIAARIPPSCALGVTDAIDFGVVDNPGVGKREDGTLSVQCSPGTAYKLEMGEGNNAAGGTRRMLLEGGSASDVLVYRLLQPDGQAWTSAGSAIAGGILSGMGSGTSESITVTGEIPAGTPTPRPGTYRDTVIVNLIY